MKLLKFKKDEIKGGIKSKIQALIDSNQASIFEKEWVVKQLKENPDKYKNSDLNIDYLKGCIDTLGMMGIVMQEMINGTYKGFIGMNKKDFEKFKQQIKNGDFS